jgi:hypothetical protein
MELVGRYGKQNKIIKNNGINAEYTYAEITGF